MSLRPGVLSWLGRRRSARAAGRRSTHLARTERAAAEAVADDPAFDADDVRAKAAELFVEVQKAWDADDRKRLAELVEPELMVEWKKRLDDFRSRSWRNRVTVLEGPDVELVRITNAAEDQEDRVVVHVSARVRDVVVFVRRTITLDGRPDIVDRDEYWHLRREGDGWRLESIEQEREGAYNLTAGNIAVPWADGERLLDEAVAEVAGGPAGIPPAELAGVDFAGPARARAMDLALADGRFDPDFIEASVRRAVRAWAAAVDGPDDALRAAATEAAIGDLLYPDSPTRRHRLVVRGPRVRAIRIRALDPAAQPPTVTVEVDVTGRCYIEHRYTGVIASGTRDRDTRFSQAWLLGLEGDGDWPWRITAVSELVA